MMVGITTERRPCRALARWVEWTLSMVALTTTGVVIAEWT